MLSKSSKWELGSVHYIAKFTISRFVISRFECIVSQSLVLIAEGSLHRQFGKFLNGYLVKVEVVAPTVIL